MSGFLKATLKKGTVDVTSAHDAVLKTLVYRKENNFNRPDVLNAIETAPCRSFWPYAFADNAPDGSPVELCRLSRLSVSNILSNFPEDEVVHFFGLWCEHTMRLYGNSVREDAPTTGSYHVYDCRDVSWMTLLSDVRSHWSSVSRVVREGQENWPGISSRYFVIFAPRTVHYLWKIVSPLVNEHTKTKVSFSKGLPPELVQALGGEEAVKCMLECSPHTMPS